MFKPNTHSLLFCLAALLALQAGPANADAPRFRADTQRSQPYPADYPAGFQNKGIIAKVDSSKRQIIIDGLAYSYGIGLKVHTLGGGTGSRIDLKKGLAIGFSFDRDPKGKHTVTEIWEIPKKDYRGS